MLRRFRLSLLELWSLDSPPELERVSDGLRAFFFFFSALLSFLVLFSFFFSFFLRRFFSFFSLLSSSESAVSEECSAARFAPAASRARSLPAPPCAAIRSASRSCSSAAARSSAALGMLQCVDFVLWSM